jgi:signal transduction histidine kinase/ActR/RegA family two-component response regulator
MRELSRNRAGGRIADALIVPAPMRLQLGRLVVLPLATIGVLAAILTWEIEHVGSILLSLAITGSGVLIGVLVARRVRARIDELSDHYSTLLGTADEQSRRAEDANRLKDEFLAMLSHELRTPLNSVLGWARLLASGKLDQAQTIRAVQAIERAGWAQSQLIEDLLDISRIVSGKLTIAPRPTVIQPIVDTVLQSLQTAASAKRIALSADVDPKIGPINADPDRLYQIIWNLASNAIKFTPTGGRVRISVEADPQQVRVAVSDNGVGFAPDAAAHLFERFRQGDSSTTRQYGGLGLGLGIVRHLVEAHGGTVSARSAGPNRGATFEAVLPCQPAHNYSTMVSPPAEAAPLLRGISVLVVDDDPTSLDFAKSSLEQHGAVVMTAGSVRETRERFARQPPDVLLSDLRMPGEDGIQLIREVRELDARRGTRTPAAALTALARTEDRRCALNAGYQMHVAKPIDPFELAVAVEQLAHSEVAS